MTGRALAVAALTVAAALGRPAVARPQAPEAAGAGPITDSVYVADVGPGRSGRLLRFALGGSRVVYRPGRRLVLGKDQDIPTTVVVLGNDVALDGRIRGDLIVVGADAFLHPGAVVDGRAIAIGGCVYASKLATLRGGLECFQDETFEVRRDAAGRLSLHYRSIIDRRVAFLSFPLYGFREPSYDRVNGLSLPVGPTFNIDTGRITVEPVVTYRSNLGDWDPGVRIRGEIGRRTTFEAYGERGTYSNEDWIRGRRVNSLTTLLAGQDVRNYYRADRFDGRLRRRWETFSTALEPWVGAATERAWSVGPDTATRRSASVPWAILRRNDVDEGMRRANPRVLHGRITSALGGARLDWASQGVTTVVDLGTEVSLDAPSDRGFVQGVLDARVAFPAIRNHSIVVALRALATRSDSTPPQRYSYLGGSGTIPTRDLLSMGGDQLVHLDSRYNIPLTRPTLPYLGAPVITVRHVMGSAGVGELPDFVQNLGARVSLSLLFVEFMVDPANGDTNFGFGLSFGR
ncbi:MAG: hypothetical protein ACJ8AO_21580 [Gemmatimonadaceae bacterium]